MKKKKVLGALVYIMAIGILAGCNKDDAADSKLVAKEMPVQIAEVSFGSLSDSNRLTGTIIPETEVEVAPKASGEFKKILVKKGDEVKAGDVLAQLDDAAERNTVMQQHAALKQAKSGLKSTLSGKTRAEKSYTQALASVRQVEASLAEAKQGKINNLDNIEFQIKNAETALNQAKQNLTRMKALLEEGLISQQNYEEAENAEVNAQTAYNQVVLNKNQAGSDISLHSLEASVDQAQVGASIAQSSIQEAQAGIESAQAAVDLAQLSVDAANDKLSDKVIVATSSGEITELNGEIGAMASGQQLFAKIVSIDKVKISVNVVPEQLLGLSVGTPVNVELNGKQETVLGIVSYVSVVGSGSGLFTVEAEIENKEHKLRPGTVATILLKEVLEENALIVPTTAIIQKEGKSVVFIHIDGMVFPKEVEVLRYGTDVAAVDGDLKEKDQVVIKGQNLLNEGDLVKNVEED